MAKIPDFKPGEMLPGTKYRVVKQIGAGGMGVVYQVVKPPEIHGVLKLMSRDLTERQEYRTRFLDEVRILAQLDHPNIVKVSDYDSLTDGTPFYVMELLHGRTVGDAIATMGTVPPRVAFEIVRQLCEALHCAHTHDIPVVHRDIKPENIFLHAPRHGPPVVKLIDFGVVAVGDRQHDGAFVGTWKYAAPEQIRGDRATPATDLYAVGLVLYEMLCGVSPFDHLESGTLVSQAQLHEIPPPVSKFAPWVPPSIVALIEAALAKDPLKRPRDAYEFAEKLYELEWANDGKGLNRPARDGSIARVLTTVAEAQVTPEPPAARVPTPPPSVPVIGIQADARHEGPTLQGVGGGQRATSPGEDVLLEGLLDRADLTQLPKRSRLSGPPAEPTPQVERVAGVRATPHPAAARAKVEAPTLEAPPSEPMIAASIASETTETDGDTTTRRRPARSTEATNVDTDTFASQHSDARPAPRSRRGIIAIAIALFVLVTLLGIGTFTRYRRDTASASPHEAQATTGVTAAEMAPLPARPVVPPAPVAATTASTGAASVAKPIGAKSPPSVRFQPHAGRPPARIPAISSPPPSATPAPSATPPKRRDDSFIHEL